MRQSFRILLAEDDEDDRLFFREAVSRNGRAVIVDEAFDGLMLLDLLDKSDNLPDMIVLDINMPLLDGIECVRAIRSHTRFSKVPVAVLSTSGNATDMKKASEAGADFYARKPACPKQLQEIVNSLISLDEASPYRLNAHALDRYANSLND